MKTDRRGLRAAGAGLMLTLSCQTALAQTAAVTAPAVPAPKPVSAFVRCDGSPNKPSTLGTIGRLVAITAVVGLLLPQREGADPAKREKGQAGIDACNEALGGADPAKDGGRRIELIFGRAIHRMELADWDGALADLRSVTTDQPELTATSAYKFSLGLTAYNLEAMALVGKRDFKGAETTAMTMADAAPYDLINMIRAVDFIRFDDTMGEAKQRYLDRFARIYPVSLRDRAAERMAARDFAGAADDYRALAALWRSAPKWAPGTYNWDARAAVGLRLAGKLAEADALIAAARKEAAADKISGRSNSASELSDFGNASDFYTLVEAFDSGNRMRARTLFSARSDWGFMPEGALAEMARRLAPVGTPAEQSNTPILTAAQIIATRRDTVAARIDNPGDQNKDRFATYREAFGPTEFNRFAATVWKTDKSRYLGEKPQEDLKATWISTIRNGSGVPAGYAMLLHLALLAKARGEKGFLILPGQRSVFQHFVRIGSPGQEGMIPEVTFDADRVIADLSVLIPQPVRK